MSRKYKTQSDVTIMIPRIKIPHLYEFIVFKETTYDAPYDVIII